MERTETIATTGISLALMAVVAALVIPVPESWHSGWLGFYLPFGVSAFYAVTNCTTMALFISSLGSYKSKSKRAYYWIVAGLVLAILGTVQMPILTGFDLWD